MRIPVTYAGFGFMLMLGLIGCVSATEPVEISRTFEFRYVSEDPKANGETDFRGETEVFNIDQRIKFLDAYTDYASRYFGVPNLDEQIVGSGEPEELLMSIKPQPLPETRKQIRLTTWKSVGYKAGQVEKQKKALEFWSSQPGATVTDSYLELSKAEVSYKLGNGLTWRFNLQWKMRVPHKTDASLVLAGKENVLIFGFGKDGDIFSETLKGRKKLGTYKKNKWVSFSADIDFAGGEYCLYADGKCLAYGLKFTCSAIETVLLTTIARADFDDLFIQNFVKEQDPKRPYRPEILLHQDFFAKQEIAGWLEKTYDDSQWKTAELPIVHGGLREAGEDLYLRKCVTVGKFGKAILNIEMLCPGGEIWVNGQSVAKISNRHPVRLDISRHLKADSENLLAIRVDSFILKNPMTHSPTDCHTGWFADRVTLEFTHPISVASALIHTEKLDTHSAVQNHRIALENTSDEMFKGTVEIAYSPWFPREGSTSARKSFKVEIGPGTTTDQILKLTQSRPALWSAKTPRLYKVGVILKDASGKVIDDYVATTGIRTISQKDGMFYINGKREVLFGVQNMGYRMPVETIAKYIRCAPATVLAEELIMVRKMHCNMFRLHVHAAENTADGVNDPRVPEMCDQLGIMLIWLTPGWLREGAWEAIDFEGYPKYMRQVYNHPSIVIWEISNHPNKYIGKPVKNSMDFIRKTMQMGLSVDTSRLISPTTFWGHTHFKNDEGTAVIDGKIVKAPPEYTHPLCTRGSQDAVTGYDNNWSVLRKWPHLMAESCLKNRIRPFFNFEHEESIAQPNWNLSKGKPWHKQHSYEHKHDEHTIGKRLTTDEWRASQGYQAFAAYESMKKQMLFGVAGWSWCNLRGGPNMGTYKKPLIDALGHPKLCYYTHRLNYQRVLAGSDNVDVVYGPNDVITPFVMNIDEEKTVTLTIIVKDILDKVIETKEYRNIKITNALDVPRLKAFRPAFSKEGYYVIEYVVTRL